MTKKMVKKMIKKIMMRLKFLRERVFSITLKKILIIFAFGLISRVLVNYFLDINVFKEYTSYISLVYYAGMASFSVFINNMPNISFSIFDYKSVGKQLSEYFTSNELKMMPNHPGGVGSSGKSFGQTGGQVAGPSTGPGPDPTTSPAAGPYTVPLMNPATNTPTPPGSSIDPATGIIIPRGCFIDPNGDIVASNETKKTVHDILKPYTDMVKSRNQKKYITPTLSKVMKEYYKQNTPEDNSLLSNWISIIVHSDPYLAKYRGTRLQGGVALWKIELGPKTLFNKRLRNE